MALFNPRKRSNPGTVMVEEVVPAPSAPAPEPVPLQLAQPSPALRGGGLRLVSPTEAGLRLATPVAPAPEIDESRADDVRGPPLGTILYRSGLLQQEVLEGALDSRLHRPVTEVVVSKSAFDALLLDLDQPRVAALAPVLVLVESAVDDPEHYHEPQEETTEQVWADGHVEKVAPEAWAAETRPQ